MACGADCIDDMDLLRHGGMPRLFDQVRAPSMLGTFLARRSTRRYQEAQRWLQPEGTVVRHYHVWSLARINSSLTATRRSRVTM
jgi:hypothetical protein